VTGFIHSIFRERRITRLKYVFVRGDKVYEIDENCSTLEES
jgi:hypothetical protein